MTPRRLTVVLLAGAAVLAAVLALAGRSPAPSYGDGGTQVFSQPVLGLPASDITLLGAAPDADGGGQVLGIGTVTGAPPLAKDGTPMPLADSGQVLVQHSEAGGWRAVQPLAKTDGTPLAAFTPFPGPQPGRVTPKGGVVLAGTDRTDPLDPKILLLARDPGGALAPLPDPPADDPATPIGGVGGGVLRTGEDLAEDPDRLALAAVDQPDGHTGVFVGLVGRSVEDRVAHWDGAQWTREDVIVPAGTSSTFRILAIAAAGADDLWMLVRPQSSLGRGIVLYHRENAPGGGHQWVEHALGSTPFADAASPADGIEDVSPGGYPGEPLSATSSGVWVDGSVQAGGERHDLTLYYDTSAGKVTGSWCDASGTAGAVCDHPLGSTFSTDRGYRSFAWPGSAFGARILTNPLDASGQETSNRGTYLSLQGSVFARIPGAGGDTSVSTSGAFALPTEGWLGARQGLVHVTTAPADNRLQAYPTSFRRPLTAVATEPGKTVGAADAQALAVGSGGAVARYTPGKGWLPEFLLTSRGSRATPRLRGVAWPEATRAYAVGDNGEMWLWRAATGLWEKDEGAPFDFQASLMDIAFKPGSPEVGYAVGKEGVLLRYDKSWTQDTVPAGYTGANFTKIAYAGSQALVAAGDAILVNDGDGWKVDQGAKDLIAKYQGSVFTVAGLPDGGAVAAGHDLVLERDGPSAPWHLSRQPLPGTTVVAAAAVRAGDQVRAVVSVFPTGAAGYPVPDNVPPTDPSQPPVLTPPFPLPSQGFVLRESGQGWQDEEHLAFSRAATDLPYQPDPVLALAVGPDGTGWAIGGETGNLLGDLASPDAKARTQTAGIYRYPAGGAAPSGVGSAPVNTPATVARFAVGGDAACAAACAELSNTGIGPDVWLTAAQNTVAAMAGAGAPRAFLYTGGRVHSTGGEVSATEEARYAAVAQVGAQNRPFFPAVSADDVADGSGAAFKNAFAAFAAPFGAGGSVPGITTTGIPGATPTGGARTHYAFDSAGDGGTVRVVVIDNAAGSLAAADANQNPREPQEAWLRAVLRDARNKRIPAIVMGSRDLNSGVSPASNVATDADKEAQILVDEGASAYFFNRPAENRQYPIPAGAATTIPSFGTGTLGYGPSTVGAQYFSESGVLLAEVDTSRRDPTSNRAPVNVRLIPVVGDLAIDATDGTLLRRSRPGLFQALARRPLAGTVNSDAGLDPYVGIPASPCQGSSSCSTRIAPEYTFTSSDPDLGDFVRQDPASSNPRAVYLDGKGKTVTDHTSGLFCAFNAGTTTVTVSVGGRSYSTPVTIQNGSVDRPCGTRALDVKRFPPTPPPTPTPPPGGAPAATPSAPPPVPPPAVAAAVAAVPSAKAVVKALRTLPVPAALPPSLVPAPVPGARAVVPPSAPTAGNPAPPSGVVARVFQVEEKREEEVAPEQSQAFSAYAPDDNNVVGTGIATIALVIIAAGAGAELRRRRRRPRGGRPAPAHAVARTRSGRR